MKNTVKRISILASAFVMAVTSCFTAITASGADKTVDLSNGYASETICLSDAEAIAGNRVMVQLSLNTGNQCMGYNLDIEFDSCLTLVSVDGAMTWDVCGNVATIIGFSGMAFKDGQDIATLIFETPENASEGTEYNIGVKNVTDLPGVEDKIETLEVKNSTVEVLESAKKVTNYVNLNSSRYSELGLRGDANDDGMIDLYDTIEIAKHMAGVCKISGNAAVQADIDEDGTIGLYDAIALCKYTIAPDKSAAWEAILK